MAGQTEAPDVDEVRRKCRALSELAASILQDTKREKKAASYRSRRDPRWECRVPKGTRWRFCYTTVRKRVEGKTGYVAYAMKEKPFRSENYVETRKLVCSSQQKARNKTYKWYCQKAGLEFRNLEEGEKDPPSQVES